MTARPLPNPGGADMATGYSFDRLAAAHDDGLLPAFRKLFAGLAQPAVAGNITDIATYMPAAPRQSGPNPRGPGDSRSTPGILKFPVSSSSHQQRAQEKRTGKEA